MNKLQLQYIKDQQKQNIITLPSVQKREYLDNSVIEELEVIYNPDLLGAETEFKSTLADISLPHDFLDDTRMISIIRTYGAEAILIYIFLHTKMCKEGYKIEWNDMQEDVYSATLFIYKVDITKFKDILKAFLDNKLLYIITDTNNINWLTSIYQVFMYERVSAKRVRDRIYKRNQLLLSDEKIKIKCVLPVFEESLAPDVFHPIGNDDLPFEPITPSTSNSNTDSNLDNDDNICF